MNKEKIVKNLNKILNNKNIIYDNLELDKYNKDWRGFFNFKCICAIFPETKEEIEKIVLFCNKNDIKIIPQGGNTSLTGSSVPTKDNYEIILNLKKLNKIIKLDKQNELIEVESGVTLDSVKEYADKNNFYFPISLTSSGSCQIGGNIATNAGGINALKYGSMIENVRGLSVILADGSNIECMSPMKKNNTGYNIKNLFIGSEGTLGIIYKCLLKIYPKPKDYFHCMIAFNSIPNNINFFIMIRNFFVEQIESAEIIPKIAIDLTIKHGYLKKSFFNNQYESFLLLKFSLYEEKENFEKLFIEKLVTLTHKYEDLIIPKSINQENNLWKFRDDLVESYKLEGKYITNDISLPLDKMSEFIEKTSKEIKKIDSNIRIYPFGHLGDGNIHFNMIIPKNLNNDFDFLRDRIYKIVNDSVFSFGGSFSAEHGIGIIKKNSFEKYKDKNEIAIMKKIKISLDPKNIMNPGKIFNL